MIVLVHIKAWFMRITNQRLPISHRNTNRRMRKLYEDAIEYASIQCLSRTNEREYRDDYEKVLFTKFAELIVKECVSVGSQAFLKDNRTVPVFPAKQITKHFGVE